jgi:ABC-type bacteriocin/lantibiotic exporter with double-glycine peptidase domain
MIIGDSIQLIISGEKVKTNSVEKCLKKYNDDAYKFEKFSTKLSSFVQIFSDLAPYTILILATYLIIKGQLQIGTLLAFSMLIPRLFSPVQELVGKEMEYQTLGVNAKRVFSLFK